MTHDVRQWLAEIKLLQQKLSEAQKERDEAYASAANWRNLYETEAKQRRTEAHLTRQTIDSLRAELQGTQDAPVLPAAPSLSGFDPQEVDQIQDVAELQQRLLQAIQTCEQLAQALRLEQSNHAQTRAELTAALGDAIDLLSKRPTQSVAQPAEPPRTEPRTEAPRNPSLELPQLD